MKKCVKGAVVITMAAGLSLWNMESKEVIALAPITTEATISKSNLMTELAEDSALLADTGTGLQEKISQLQTVRKVRVKEQKIAERKARLKKIRLHRMKEIQACCGVRVSERDRTILERIVEAEAGDQDSVGKRLVANVILNRVKSSKFPSTIKEVVFAPRQFSPVSDGRYYTVTVSEDTKKAVSAALQGVDGSKGALYFMDRRYSDSSNVRWFDTCLTRLFAHQSHEFFR